MTALGCGTCVSLSVPVRGEEKGLLAVLQAQIEGQMASPANSTDCHLLMCVEGGAGVCVCVCQCICVCRVGEEVRDGGGAELEQLIKH